MFLSYYRYALLESRVAIKEEKKLDTLLVTVANGQRFVNDERCQGCCKERNLVVT